MNRGTYQSNRGTFYVKRALLTKLKGHFSYGKRGTFGVLEKVGGIVPSLPPPPPPGSAASVGEDGVESSNFNTS